MEHSTGDAESSGIFSLSTPNPVRDVLLVGTPIVVLGALGTLLGLSTIEGGALVNLGYVLAVFVGAILLKRQGSSWLALGLTRPASWVRTVLAGVGAGVGAAIVFVAVQALVLSALLSLGVPVTGIDQSRFNPIEGNLHLFLLMVLLAWTTIAVAEEWFYRAFLITRLTDHANVGQWLAILVAGALFGAVHFAEGPVGVLSNGAFGVLFGWIYLRSGRNMWITVVGHGLLNTLRFSLLYAGAA
ncbi:CPBP family intramembrane glutamic endopeptidase [Halorussus halophilus]|uniref:CPBP family intramembrane glutamic endopeptidase n=1 Tax=Halorussus halophilus TaxID=2650975 RepID=UPI0013014083|nr:CPBP family intramembrane glutamic endopeptidase [Halorussus halophilus]